jgi:hypothetical protein
VETRTAGNQENTIMETGTYTLPPNVETVGIITTRYIGPTDHKPGRVKAISGSGASATYSWNHGLGIFENHRGAALALAGKLGIAARRVVGGGLHDSGYAFAFLP